MNVRSFLDANILVYTDDADNPEKRSRCLDLFERARLERWGVVSTQVLQEYFSAATRKLRVAPEIARRKVELFGQLDLFPIELADILGAVDLHRLHGFSFWDALVVRAAIQARCSVLFTEDLQHDRRIDGLRVVNPFIHP
jgi:predicted nucleic acid-binding protein